MRELSRQRSGERSIDMNSCEALIIGGSAGSLEVLLRVLPDIDTAVSFPIIIVLHRKSGKDKILIDLFSAKTKLKVKEIKEKEKIVVGTIYIAPPNYHILVENDQTFSLDASEKINYSRPSIDVAFESCAEVFGKNLVGLLLSGANSDGSDGLQKIKKYGGKTAVQDPENSVVSYMPEYALKNVEIDAVLNPAEMADFINKL